MTRDADQLTEAVRQALSRTITGLYAGKSRELKVITLDPPLEKSIMEAVKNTAEGAHPVLGPRFIQGLVESLLSMLEKLRARGMNPVVLTSAQVRLPLRRLLEKFIPDVPVLSINEIRPEVKVEAVGVIKENES
jgi:flagellar biosynthesis protein FlhA